MKKLFAIALLLTLTLSLLAACGTAGSQTPSPSATEPTSAEPSGEQPTSESADTPPAPAALVYMTTDISPEGLQAVYETLDIAPADGDKVAIKVSTGEPPSSNDLRQELIGEFVKGLNGTRFQLA